MIHPGFTVNTVRKQPEYASINASIGAIRAFQQACEVLMQHWHQLIAPAQWLEVQYEALVSDLEGGARRLVDFAGLPWDPACIEFHRTSRSVYTASTWQVRQPVYSRSVERWRHYAPYIAGLESLAD